ncbi:MAG: PQQ-binding-like beta-propeller repeat protein [Phycisphaerales bacterium]
MTRATSQIAVAPFAMAALLALAGAAPIARGDDWPMLARDANRVSLGNSLPPLGTPAWIASTDPAGAAVSFPGQTGVVADNKHVYAIGTVGGQTRVLAYDVVSGAPRWSAAVPTPLLESWAAPAVDVKRDLVIVGTGFVLAAINANTGVVEWQTPLPRPVVNASPVITSDRFMSDRALVTLFDGFASDGRLVCVNVDPFDATWNPYIPGQIVWSIVIGGSSGNSPAYADGVVYVASTGAPSGGERGQIIARRIDDPPTAPNLWTFENPQELGFFGGVCVGSNADNTPSVFAASYAFAGGLDSANLVKLSASTGALRWSVPCNRTSSIPVPLPGGYILLSGGLSGFGSAPSVELFKDLGSSAELVWNSAQETWIDLNGNQVLDPGEYLRLGGWTQMPVVVPAPDRASGPDSHLRLGPQFHAAIGAIPIGASTSTPSTDFYVIDVARRPGQSGFIKASFPNAGASPALVESGTTTRLFSIGAAGLHCFASSTTCYANCDGSTVPPILNVNDFICFIGLFAAYDPRANCDASTIPPTLNVVDFVCFANRFAEGCP